MDKIWYENFEPSSSFKLAITYFHYNPNWKSTSSGSARESPIDNRTRMSFLSLARRKFWSEYETNGAWKLKLELIAHIGHFFVCHNIRYVHDRGFWRIFTSSASRDPGSGATSYFQATKGGAAQEGPSKSNQAYLHSWNKNWQSFVARHDVWNSKDTWDHDRFNAATV